MLKIKNYNVSTCVINCIFFKEINYKILKILMNVILANVSKNVDSYYI